VTSRNTGHGLDSFPYYAVIFHMVGQWCSDGAPLSARRFGAGPCRYVPTCGSACRLVRSMAGVPGRRLVTTVHCGQPYGSLLRAWPRAVDPPRPAGGMRAKRRPTAGQGEDLVATGDGIPPHLTSAPCTGRLDGSTTGTRAGRDDHRGVPPIRPVTPPAAPRRTPPAKSNRADANGTAATAVRRELPATTPRPPTPATP
jgi:hypothetical protein